MRKKKKTIPRMRVVVLSTGYRVICPRGFKGLNVDLIANGKTKEKAMSNMIVMILQHIGGLEHQIDTLNRLLNNYVTGF